jgi:hypothetical protein
MGASSRSLASGHAQFVAGDGLGSLADKAVSLLAEAVRCCKAAASLYAAE